MELVSRLCFPGTQAPQPELVQRLMQYVTRQRVIPLGGMGDAEVERLQTKQLSVFDDYIDDNPVFRSFLLQLLLKVK